MRQIAPKNNCAHMKWYVTPVHEHAMICNDIHKQQFLTKVKSSLFF